MAARNLTQALWVALQEQGPLIVVLYEEHTHRSDLAERIRYLLPAGVASVDSDDLAAALTHPDQAVLLAPPDEPETLLQLEGIREQLLPRTQPVILFLLRGGAAIRLLKEIEGASLASWLRGRIIDAARLERVDVSESKERFVEMTGLAPSDWLASWRSGAIADTQENQLTYHEAMLLVEEREA